MLGVVRPRCLSPPTGFGRRVSSRTAGIDERMHSGAMGGSRITDAGRDAERRVHSVKEEGKGRGEGAGRLH